MEQLFSQFKNDYSLAMENYRKGAYTYFFRNIRPAIEWLCKLIIADMVEGKSKPSDIFNGEKVIRRSGSEYSIQSGNRNSLRGRQLTDVVLSSFLLKRKDVREARLDEILKALRENMEMYCGCIKRFYSVASASNHSSERTDEADVEATKYASILSDFISFLIEYKILNEENLARLRTIAPVRIVDERKLAEIQNEKQLIASQYNKQKAELEEALNKIEESKKQQEEIIRKSQESASEKEERIRQLESEIELMKKASSIQISSHNIKSPDKRSGSELDLDDDKMDYDQEDIILATDSQSLIVCGCAGSGKSVIAMKKAKALYESGADVVTIAYTKSLNNYMRSGISSDIGRFYYHHQWKKACCPTADYLIVDEIQDFTEEEIKEFIRSAKKHFYFFGDSAQSIYTPFKRGIINMKRISELSGLGPMMLHTNYRLPRTVAKITQKYVGVNVEPYSDRIYKNESSNLPRIMQCEDLETQTIALADFIEANNDKSIGVFLPDNAAVLQFCEQLSSLGVAFEFKYELQKARGHKSGYKPFNTLDFSNLLPKVMTYHSAKGLQFEIVILPWYRGASTEDEKKALYVAMTRTQSQLIITYTGELKSPLKEVPKLLYKTGLSN